MANDNLEAISDSDIDYPDEDSDRGSGSDSDRDFRNPSSLDLSLDNYKNESWSKYYKGLTVPQKQAFLYIYNLFAKKKNVVVTINTESGSGKTFLLTVLAKTYTNSVEYITFRRDQASEIKLKLKESVSTYTFISFYVNCLHLSYQNAVYLFNSCEVDDIDMLYKLILYAKRYLSRGKKIMVVDSCTLPSASMLLLLYIISLKHQMHIIFAGNKLQLSTLHKSSIHNRCNFDMIKLLNDETINKLSGKRSADKTLMNKVLRFQRMIERNRPKNEVPFHFNLRYYLYCCFRSKYFAKEDFNVIYMAQFHQNITDRTYRFIDYLKASGTKHFVSPFYINKGGVLVPISMKQKGKFFPGLVLAEGYKYIYVDDRGIHHTVLLEKIKSADKVNADTLKVRFVETNRSMRMDRHELNFYQILPTFRCWLVYGDKILYQFPLRPYTLTYHAALGKIIEQKVELSADCSFANNIYVGLCCVRNYEDIRKIHAKDDLPNFVITDYMRKEKDDKEYYYRCPSNLPDCDKEKIMRYVHEAGPNDFIDNIKWYTLSEINQFERRELTYYARIPRSLYEKPNKESEKKGNTRLMKIADFVKHNSNAILSVMSKVTPVDLDKYHNNKRINSLEFRKSRAYTSLKEEYIKWIGREG